MSSRLVPLAPRRPLSHARRSVARAVGSAQDFPLSAGCTSVAGQEDFGNTEGAVIIIGSGIAGLSSAASLHKVSLASCVSLFQ